MVSLRTNEKEVVVDTIIIVLQCAVLVAVAVAYGLLVRDRFRQRAAERQAGWLLVRQMQKAPEGATIILGAATYRIAEPIKINKNGITFEGASGLSWIVGEGNADPLIHVGLVKGVTITDHCLKPIKMTTIPLSAFEFDDGADPGPVAVVVAPEGEEHDLAEILNREYREPLQ